MRKLAVLILLLVIFASTPVFAHPGNTAADGAHYCRTRCDYWGVPWNERHTHGGYVAQPVLTYKDWTQDVIIPYQQETKDTDTLDKGQTRVVRVGVAGKAVDKWRENFSDGTKTGETAKVRTVVTEPINQITEIGTREPITAPTSTPASSNDDGGGGTGTLIGIGTIAGIAYLIKLKSGDTPAKEQKDQSH